MSEEKYTELMKPAQAEEEAFSRLNKIVKILRAECPWDREQTYKSLVPCMLEEAYEAVDAVNNHNMENFREELGDVLLQVMMNSIIAAENGDFLLLSVINDECDKMIRRHPHIFFGDNAQGKTNLLESIYVSGTLRSHRGSRDKDLIRFGEDEAHIRLFFRKDSLSHRLDVHLKKNKSKGVAVDGVPVRRSGELLGMMHIVFFSPEDLSIIKEGPAGRRRFLDMELSQIDKGYMQQLVAYSKILNERNNLLKQINLYPALIDTLDGWDEQLLAAGQFLIKKREEFVYFLDEMMAKIHGQLTGGKEQIKVEYEKNVEAEKFREQLYSKRNKDISSGTTSVGPHRDDLRFKVGGIDIRKFGSQGQQRTAALSLKLSEIRLIEQVTGEKPILLLDDVLSELDAGRQSWLLESIQDIQTLISCTGLDDFVNSRISLDKVFRVKEGIVQEEKTDGLV